MNAPISTPRRPSSGHYARLNALVDEHMASMSDTELRVALVLLKFSDIDGVSFPSIDTVAGLCGCKARAVYAALSSLAAKGIVKTTGGAGGGRSKTASRQLLIANTARENTVSQNTVSPRQETLHGGAQNPARPRAPYQDEHTNNRPVNRPRRAPMPRRPVDLPEIPEPLNAEPFTTAWGDWRRHRVEIKKPLKPTTVAHQFALLEPLGPSQAALCIKISIQNGWTGLFPEKLSQTVFQMESVPTQPESVPPAPASASTPVAPFPNSEVAALSRVAAAKSRNLGRASNHLRLIEQDFRIEHSGAAVTHRVEVVAKANPFALRLIENSGIPEMFRDAEFGDLRLLPEDAKAEHNRVLLKLGELFVSPDRPRLVLLGGGYGVGKSHATAALVLSFCRAGKYAMWYDGRDFINHARAMATSSYTDVRWSVWMERYRRMRLLIIDEVLAECRTPFAQERIEEVVNARYANRLDTILTGNAVDSEEFRAVLGSQIVDRAMDGGGLLFWKGPSMRGRLL